MWIGLTATRLHTRCGSVTHNYVANAFVPSRCTGVYMCRDRCVCCVLGRCADAWSTRKSLCICWLLGRLPSAFRVSPDGANAGASPGGANTSIVGSRLFFAVFGRMCSSVGMKRFIHTIQRQLLRPQARDPNLREGH